MQSIKANFDKVLLALKKVTEESFSDYNKRIRPGPRIKFTDIEIVALSFTAAYMGITSENCLFKYLNKKDFPNLLSRRQYNDRLKLLLGFTEEARKLLASKIKIDGDQLYIIDSMPLRVCKFSRRKRNKIGFDRTETTPNIGYCAAQDERYYGYKLHALCSRKGVIVKFDITPASVHDINFLKDVAYDFKNCTIIGDKGYISEYHKKNLLERRNINLVTDLRSNQKALELGPTVFKGKRKRIETVFSQLNDQFNIQRHYAKSFIGYCMRLISKVASMTVINFINSVINKRPTGQLKYALL